MRFELPLQCDASQRSAGVVERGDADDDAGVGIALVARILAHAVGDHAVRFGSGGDHGAAGTHAETVNAAAVAAMMHQLVVGGTEQRVAGVWPETRLIDQCLRVFDAQADREGLGLHEHAGSVQHREGVAGAVAECQDDLLGAQLLAARQCHATYSAVFDVQAADALLKTDFAAELFDLATHLFDHADQPEGADVRFADVENLRRGAGLDEFHQHLAPVVPGVLDLAVGRSRRRSAAS
ncbi:MAG: hypothetical protein AW09_002510 [Candidatus Accumulibacter phosphatis]|uniref:Uncharacterized protein n=1 Tax=Candidatus Accumulibacter phosphatis TaxID=327160 RepID=A0A080LUL8_9PROT|nr:MAG: hypothetical protein AW09_002510 [Candidatus Accumulibacter phosphatis]